MLARVSNLALLLVLTACDPGDVVLLAPDKSPSDAPSFTIHAVIDTPYVDLADALFWTAGVPRAHVRVHRMVEPYDDSYWQVATADSVGIATFVALLAGPYEVQVTRWLNGAEMVEADSALHLFAGGRRLRLTVERAQPVMLAPNHGSRLVFSEISMDFPGNLDPSVGGDAKYFELYNNSDTTIYLDGKYWGIAWHLNRDYPSWPCVQTEPVRNDPDGIWTERIFRFPGRGTDYPLPPGGMALIAKAAIDHRAVHPDLYDLSGADFEWGGMSSPDNPEVPNLQEIGLRPMPYHWPVSEQPQFVSEPVVLETLPRYTDPSSGYTWVRIPTALVLDAWVDTIDWTTHSYEATPACLEQMHRSFERLAGPAAAHFDFENGLTVQRRVLYVLPDGRNVLQDTDTSMEDFVKAVRTPGWIPDSLGHR
jgi:hypothetical protein